MNIDTYISANLVNVKENVLGAYKTFLILPRKGRSKFFHISVDTSYRCGHFLLVWTLCIGVDTSYRCAHFVSVWKLRIGVDTSYRCAHFVSVWILRIGVHTLKKEGR